MMDIRQLDLNLLLLLDHLYRDRNLSMSARRLGISQSMASTHLMKLRAYFEDELFVRTGRGMRPTPFADAIHGGVNRALKLIEQEVLRKPTFDPVQTERTFTITTSDIGVLIFGPPLLQALRRVAPRCSLRILNLAHEGLEDALARAEVDLAIGFFPDLTGSLISCQGLFEHPFACIVSDRSDRIGETLSLDQFLAADHVVVNQPGRSQEIFERRLRELGLQRRVLLHLPHFMSVPQIIAASDLVSTVPKALGSWYSNAGLRVLPVPIECPTINLKQFWHRMMHDDPAVRWLRQLVAETLTRRDPATAFLADYATA